MNPAYSSHTNISYYGPSYLTPICFIFTLLLVRHNTAVNDCAMFGTALKCLEERSIAYLIN